MERPSRTRKICQATSCQKMIEEHSAGAVVFNGKYLLLEYKYKSVYWDFPRGNVEKGEGELDTARREVREETGITEVTFVPDFKHQVSWFYRREGNKVGKKVTFFLALTEEKNIRLSSEHILIQYARC